MKKWIRWSGLIGFSVTIALLVGAWFFAAAPLIKMSIETLGSKAAGAKVEVEAVELSFNPLGITINGVDVADADKPMENLISIDRTVADLALMPLLVGKGIIEEMSMSGVRFGTPRSVSGALPKEEKAPAKESNEMATGTPAEKSKARSQDEKPKESALAGLAETLPSAETILEREPLATVTNGEAFKESYEHHKEKINSSVAKVPNASAIKRYEKSINSIVNGKYDDLHDFLERKKEFEALKKQFKADKKAIEEAKKALQVGKKEMANHWNALAKSPKADYQKLIDKYKLDSVGASNLSAVLFGAEAGEYARQALHYYEKVRPLLVKSEAEKAEEAEEEKVRERAKGRFVSFPTRHPQPDFWIKSLGFTGQLAAGDIAVSVKDITHQQAITNRPIRLTVKGDQLGDVTGFKLNGVLDHRGVDDQDAFELSIANVKMDSMDLGFAGLKLKQSQMAMSAKGVLKQGQIEADGIANFTRATFTTKDRTMVAKELNAALAKIPTFDVHVDAKGKMLAPKVGMNSDLDNKLQKIFNESLKEKQRELEARLKKRLEEKLLAYTGEYKATLKSLNLMDGNLKDAQKKLSKLAKAELDDYQKQLKQKKKKEADKKIEQKRKELEEKAKEKLKNLF